MSFKRLNQSDIKLISNNMNEIDDKYILKYVMYRQLFTKYIINKYNLKECDKKIIDSNLNFVSIKENDMDFYQYFSSDELKYLYIKNDIYIQNLDDKEIKFLEDKIKLQDYELDEKSKEFIEKTYKKVISENEENLTKFYGPINSNYMAKSNSIVIGYRYDEFANNGLTDKEWDQLNDKQFEYINSIIKELELKINEIEDIPVSIIKYNEFSIISRNIKKEIDDNEEEK